MSTSKHTKKTIGFAILMGGLGFFVVASWIMAATDSTGQYIGAAFATTFVGIVSGAFYGNLGES